MRHLSSLIITALLISNAGQGAAKPRLGTSGAKLRALRAQRLRPTVVVAVTGGPGVGKTTLLNALESRGFLVIPEAARKIIAQEQAKVAQHPKGQGVFPWTNLKAFNDKLLSAQVTAEKTTRRKLAQRSPNTTQGRVALADRSLVDLVGYLKNGGQVVAPKITQAIKNAGYGKIAFLLDPLPYKADAQRKESQQEAAQLHQSLADAYKKAGFTLINVPTFSHLSFDKSLEARADFVELSLKRLGH